MRGIFNFSELLHSVSAIIPELLVVSAALICLLLGLVSRKTAYGFGALTIVIAIVSLLRPGAPVFASEHFLVNNFTSLIKVVVLLSLLTVTYLLWQAAERYEIMVLAMLSAFGMMGMSSANSLLLLYVFLELTNVCLYALVTSAREKNSPEAGLKYFILSAVASGFFLYGASMIYGYSGGEQIFSHLNSADGYKNGLNLGIIFVIAAVLFKIGAFPFHIWVPDVYQGSSRIVITFLASASKASSIAVLINIASALDLFAAIKWREMFIVLALCSNLLGAFAAIKQTNIKRMIGYSAISHVGYVLIAIATLHYQDAAFYAVIYSLVTLVALTALSWLKSEDIQGMAGLANKNKFLAAIIAVSMFTMAGIPPTAGFFAKLQVIKSLSDHLIPLIILLISTAISAYYYLRVIKVMYFSEQEGVSLSVDPVVLGGLLIATCVNLSFAAISNHLYEFINLWPTCGM